MHHFRKRERTPRTEPEGFVPSMPYVAVYRVREKAIEVLRT
jgi:hypothetical protein